MDLIEIIEPTIEKPGSLWLGSAIDEIGIDQIIVHKIDVVIDLNSKFDPSRLAAIIQEYVYCPILDLLFLSPINCPKLDRAASYGFKAWEDGLSVLVHCSKGHNRSALVVGLILIKMGMSGKDAVRLIMEKRPEAFSNHKFREYLEGL